ncbi:MAG: acylglycerol kinase family protein [Acidimicrobiia bacterium]
MSEPWLVLVNLKAGRRALDPARVESALEHAGIDFDLQVPPTAAAMAEAIRSAASTGRWRLAVVGGDGTASLAANEILNTEWSRRPVLGVLPGGTGGDLLRTFGIGTKSMRRLGISSETRFTRSTSAACRESGGSDTLSTLPRQVWVLPPL